MKFLFDKMEHSRNENIETFESLELASLFNKNDVTVDVIYDTDIRLLSSFYLFMHLPRRGTIIDHYTRPFKVNNNNRIIRLSTIHHTLKPVTP